MTAYLALVLSGILGPLLVWLAWFVITLELVLAALEKAVGLARFIASR